MAKKIEEYEKEIRKALRSAGRYSPGLTGQVMSLAGALRTLDLANSEIDGLESTVIPVTTRYGNESLGAHPVFKIQKDAQDSVTRQMKALGLTVTELAGSDDNDPLIDLTKEVRKAGKKKPVVVKREGGSGEEL